MYQIENPILTGFNPDPSLCRVGEDYYIATSTFEWFPGVRIYHSRDLKNWALVSLDSSMSDSAKQKAIESLRNSTFSRQQDQVRIQTFEAAKDRGQRLPLTE